MPSPAQANLISVVANGAVPTISGLRLIDVTFTPEGSQVSVNGAVALNDGGQGTFVFNGANTGLDDGRTVISTPTTGRWIKATSAPVSGLALNPLIASASGVGERFVVLSGAGVAPLIYTFAPSYTVNPDKLTIKFIGTGQVRLQATGNDLLFDIAQTAAFTQSIVAQSGGLAYTFQATYNPLTQSGVFYRVA